MSNRRSYREQFLERIKEANPDGGGGGRGDNNETADSINLAAADSSSEKRDMQLRLDRSKIHVDIPIRFPNFSFGANSSHVGPYWLFILVGGFKCHNRIYLFERG